MNEGAILTEIEKIRVSSKMDRDEVYNLTKRVKNWEIKDYHALIGELRKFSKIAERYSESDLKNIFYNLF